MTTQKSTYSKILGTGSFLPEKALTNFDLEKLVETNDAWIVERTGIRKRHVAGANESASTMGTEAAKRAIAMAGIRTEDIGMIVVGTATPDRVFPSVAALVQRNLGLAGIPAFDLTAACSGFVYGLSVADQYIKSGAIKYALVIGAECLTRIINWQDRTTCILFGDGAGAVVLGASEEPGILSTHIHADGSYEDLLYCPNPLPNDPERDDPKDKERFIVMRGNEVFKVAVRTLSNIVDETLTANGLSKSDIDWLIPHQANMRIIQAIANKLDMPMERVVVTIGDHGNTSSASIPLALDAAVRDGRVQRGQTLLMEAFGGGFTWGSALVRF
ncbi:ketoacyl-ACP synthase III [Permianibacter sp. IMCC34836]|uniref:beta-ketoacyl-ACP synthase III n=1 Tax=Permianibacter fluminis TaxID=2738515 RepID=UPI001553A73E|nr:beta-ketoacyl-ACP synthase III [Permianibacter fluminis]NQD38903.1 ketoacyl-ACP synthase III [Permianibacter fluminis]